LIFAVIVALAGTALLVLYAKGADARAAADQELVDVLVATATIEAGESVTAAQEAGKFEKTQVRRADAVEGALVTTSSISDSVALGTIYAGEQILGPKFGEQGQSSGLAIPDDKIAVSVELTDPQRVAGFVNPGSDVAIFFSGEPIQLLPDGTRKEMPPYTRLLLEKVEVIGVGTTSVSSKTTTTEEGAEVIEQVPSTILTVAVDQEDAEKLIYASRNAEISFALLSENSKVRDGAGVSANALAPELFAGAGQ